jgi:malonate-semialdehyde dehydrogenase (acetylating)/methylmalonate-semialdehyde dehydrogenase
MTTAIAPPITKVANFFNGEWHDSSASNWQDVINPATGGVVARVPLSDRDEVSSVIEAAAAAYPAWRRTPPEDRIQPLFKLKVLLEDHHAGKRQDFGRSQSRAATRD